MASKAYKKLTTQLDELKKAAEITRVQEMEVAIARIKSDIQLYGIAKSDIFGKARRPEGGAGNGASADA